jgi:hypothetical protein
MAVPDFLQPGIRQDFGIHRKSIGTHVKAVEILQATSKAIVHLCCCSQQFPCNGPVTIHFGDPHKKSRTFSVQPPSQQPFLLEFNFGRAICRQGGGLAGIKRSSNPVLGDCHCNKVLCSCSVVLFLSSRRGEPPGDRTFVPFHNPRKGKYGPKAHFIALPVW